MNSCGLLALSRLSNLVCHLLKITMFIHDEVAVPVSTVASLMYVLLYSHIHIFTQCPVFGGA